MDTVSGYQAGSGIWSANMAHWTTNGRILVTWPGAGNTATFAGNDGAYAITVNGSPVADSIAFLSGGYGVRGGTSLITPKIFIAGGKFDTIGTIITGSNGLIKSGNGCLVLSGNNTYSGATIINGGNIRFSSLANGGSASSLGVSSNEASNLVINGGHLEYTYSGVDASTDRLFTIGTAQCSLNVSMATVHFTNTGAIALSGSGTRVFCLGGNGTATLAPTLGDNDGATSLQKYGSGTWILTGDNTYTGPTFVRPGNTTGTLQIGNGGTSGSISKTPEIRNESILRFNRSDSYAFNGVISGNGSLIQAGSGSLLLTAINNVSERTIVQRGSLLIAGSLTSRILIKVERDATLGGSGVCRALVAVDNGGAVAPGVSGPGKLMLDTLVMSTESILRMEVGAPGDTLVLTSAGTHTLDGTVDIIAATGFAAGTYRIINYSGTLSNGSHSLVIGTSPDGYDCSLSVGAGYINLNVSPDPPRITGQPGSPTLFVGDTARFYISATGISPLVYRWYKSVVAADSLMASDASFSINAVALADSGRYYCIVSNAGGSVTSDTVRLMVNQRIPGNTFHLKAEDVASTSVRLVWDPVDTASAGAIRIWYGKNTIDTGYVAPGSGLDSITLPPPDTSTIITGLTSATRYCFAIQAGRGTLWSAITGNSRTFCTTLSAGNDTDFVNSIVIDTCYFDTLAASLRISWCLDPPPPACDDIQAGITCSFSKFPVDAKKCRIINLVNPCADTLIQIHPLRFDTLCYVALWLRTKKGTWREPTAASRDSVRIGRPFRQIITFFDSAATNDTISVFNGRVTLWKDGGSSGATPVFDTAEMVAIDSVPRGMIVVGGKFRFLKADQNLPVYIGVRIDSLPSNRTIDDVRMYTDSAGKPIVNYATMIDSKQAMVYVKTARLHRTFLAMIDTMAPRTEFLSDTGTCAYGISKIEDFLHIDDNIANVRWQYLYGKGDQAPSLMQENGPDNTGAIVKLTISDTMQMTCAESGLRAYLIISDGAHCDTINMSRSVWRSESDTQTTEAKIWIPVYPTAKLLQKTGDSLIGRLPISTAVEYNQRLVRLYRWVNYEGNRDNPEKWVEYDPDDNDVRSLFSLEPGRLFWLKTRKNLPLHLGSGYTLSLKDTFTVDLPPLQWTDFGMPYRFAVRIEEILSASGSDADSIQFYRWNRDSASDCYSLEPLYVYGIPDHSDRSKTIVYTPRGGYSLYNHSLQTARLRIPPVLDTMTKKSAKVVERGGSSWSAKFVAHSDDGIRFPAVYFGYAPGIGKSAYPPAPTFASLRLSVFDRTTALRCGHAIDKDAKEGLVRELLIDNNSDSIRTIRYHFEQAGAFPENYSAFCFDAATKTLDIEGAVTVAPKATVSRWIIVSDAAFRRNFIASIMPLRFFLLAPYPNPARSVVNIRYTVPFGARERVGIAIYSILGKRVWEKRMDGPLTVGAHTAVWNGRDAYGCPVGSGLYIVRLTVVDTRGTPVKQFDRRVTWMR